MPSAYIWGQDPVNGRFQEMNGSLNETTGKPIMIPWEENFWIFNSPPSWGGDWESSYGGFLAFDVISRMMDPLAAQRDPLIEIRIYGVDNRWERPALFSL
eukprot:scaffold2390_cov41-Prasinocladus_malaysianus.AAC.1